MKIKIILYLSLIALIMSSCVTTSFYQVYKATPSEDIEVKGDYLVYEDDNCIVSYNLWGVGGNIGFRIYNKTDLNIYLNLEESFFILNGVAYDYFKNRVFTQSKGLGSTSSRSAAASKSETGTNIFGLAQTNRVAAGVSAGIISTSEYSVSFNEVKNIVIPPRTSRIITEYSINDALIRHCDLFKYPTNRQINTKRFTDLDSPIVFSNRISYYLGDTDNPIRFENEFFVSEITNYPEGEIMEARFEEFCGQRSSTRRHYFKNVAPDKFYIRYTRERDLWKH